MRQARIGTSGFSYPHWRGVLYSEGLATGRWLERYAEVFDTVELNATFYRLPSPSTVDAWRDRTPDSFVFAVKGSRYLTHMKRLSEIGAPLRRFFSRVERLGEKLGPVLWQLPAHSRVDLPRLEHFLSKLPHHLQHVFEFRHPAWYTEEVASLLAAFDVGFCEHDLLDLPVPAHTGGLRYVRMHGLKADYRGRYGPRRLEPIAQSLLAWSARGKPAYVYFNNDLGGHAVHDALTLRGLLAVNARLKYAPHGPTSPPPPPA